jgi:hypothetical protein
VKKQKQGAGGTAKGANGEISLAGHPRARQHIRMAKGWAGLAGCSFAGYVGWKAGLPFFDAVLRALLWGVASYMVVWFLAVQVWRQLAIAEVRAAEKQWLERRQEAERLARERAAQMQADMAAQS